MGFRRRFAGLLGLAAAFAGFGVSSVPQAIAAAPSARATSSPSSSQGSSQSVQARSGEPRAQKRVFGSGYSSR